MMNKFKWSALVLLLSVAGCVIRWELVTPTLPTPTLAPSTTAKATATSSLTPMATPVGMSTRAPTHMPTATATNSLPPPPTDPNLIPAPRVITVPIATAVVVTLTPALQPKLPTPVPTVNLKDVGNRLFNVASFAFDFESTSTQAPLHFQVRWIRTPPSWHIRKIEKSGQVIIEHVAIGEREWAIVADSLFPVPCTEWQKQPQSSLVYSTCKLGRDARSIIESTLGLAFQDQKAEFASGPVVVDNVPTYDYTWRDKGGAVYHLYLAAEGGIPIMFKVSDITFKFSRFSDPANVIAPPTSAMPERLHMDDARMALNRLASFQYVTNAEIKDSTYNVKGVYVQANQAWRAEWRWKPEDAEPFLKLASIGDQAWLAVGKSTTWLPSALLPDSKQMVDDASPFANWPSSSFQEGILQPGSKRAVSGLVCNEYIFTASATTKRGNKADFQARLCVTADSLIPLRLETSISVTAEGFRSLITRELSHLNDPSNVVEPPGK